MVDKLIVMRIVVATFRARSRSRPQARNRVMRGRRQHFPGTQRGPAPTPCHRTLGQDAVSPRKVKQDGKARVGEQELDERET